MFFVPRPSFISILFAKTRKQLSKIISTNLRSSKKQSIIMRLREHLKCRNLKSISHFFVLSANHGKPFSKRWATKLMISPPANCSLASKLSTKPETTNLRNRLSPTPELFRPGFLIRVCPGAITAVTEEDFVVTEVLAEVMEVIAEEDDSEEERGSRRIIHGRATVKTANGSATPENNVTGGDITATATEIATATAMSTTN